MDIVGAFDLHRKQIAFDYIEMETGEVHRGKIQPADRENLRLWLECFTERFPGRDAAIAVEATTGWRFVVEELRRAGVEPHLAEPAETKSLRGRKKRAKTDRLDAGHLRDLLAIERLPESWIPPEHIQEIRTLMRMRHAMIEERSAYQGRIHAQLFHNGYLQQRNVLAAQRRERLQNMELPAAARKVQHCSATQAEDLGGSECPSRTVLCSHGDVRIGGSNHHCRLESVSGRLAHGL
jgi:transposase